MLRAGFEPATYGYLLRPLQSTALPTELPEVCERLVLEFSTAATAPLIVIAIYAPLTSPTVTFTRSENPDCIVQMLSPALPLVGDGVAM